MNRTSLRARWVLPISEPPLSGGVVTIENDRIVAVGHSADGHVEDLGDVVLMPGWVNAHTHLEFSDCEKPLGRPGMALPEWIRQVIGTRHRHDRNSRDAVQKGMAESLADGVTSLGEISTTPASVYEDWVGSQLIAFQEVIGFSAARRESVLSDLDHRLESGEPIPEVTLGVSPHAPYTVHPELLDVLIATARELNLPVAIHLAESREELELLQSGTGPFQQLLADRSMWDSEAIPLQSTPLDYLKKLAEARRSLVIHGNYLSDTEIEFVAAHRVQMSVVYCPRTHAYFGHDPYPLDKMISAGIRVALGTDSRASNPDLSLLAEMRYVATRYPSLAPESVLQMGTIAGAEALGIDDQTGSLEVGKLADLVSIPAIHCDHPIEAILHSTAQPSHVFVRGLRVELTH